MKVTVVVRTYNRPEFLKEALVSIQLQTHTDWEVLIFDDAASVENFSIYNKFKEENPDKFYYASNYDVAKAKKDYKSFN